MRTHLVASYFRLFLSGKRRKMHRWRKALQEARSDKLPQAYLQMQSMKQNFNELCHIIWRLMSCKSLCQLQWLGTNSFSFKINERILGSALPQSGTLGKKEVVRGVPSLQLPAARLPSVLGDPLPSLIFKSRLHTRREPKTVWRSNGTAPVKCQDKMTTKGLEWL